jgi:hypothetical protein
VRVVKGNLGEKQSFAGKPMQTVALEVGEEGLWRGRLEERKG